MTRAAPLPRSLVVVVLAVVAVSLATLWWRDRADERFGVEMAHHARPGDIRMLSSLRCPYCTLARQWFERHGVAFDECFIERDAACRAEFDALPVRATPTLVVRGEVQTGFSAERVAAALRR